MKTLRISDDVHEKLTALLGELMVQTSKMQTYQDAIEAMLSQSVILPPELLIEIENFIEKNKQLGFTTREEFMRDAARWRLRFLSNEYEYVEVRKEKYEKAESIIKEMNMPFLGVTDFLDKQLETLLEKYDAWLQEKQEHDKRQRKGRIK